MKKLKIKKNKIKRTKIEEREIVKRNLGGELSAEAVAKEDDGVGVHEMAEARSSACNLRAWLPWIFDGS